MNHVNIQSRQARKNKYYCLWDFFYMGIFVYLLRFIVLGRVKRNLWMEDQDDYQGNRN